MVESFPRTFQTRNLNANGVTLHVRAGGQGSAVVMLHGFGDTGDMWAPVAAILAKDHRVVVPDLRGMGLSSHPENGYDKKTQAHDIAAVMDKLKIEKAAFVTHDIGNMVGYAFAAQFPARVSRWVVIDAPLPGIGPWDEITRSPLLWHFNFRGPDVERLVKGRERIYLDRFWNELSANPKAIKEATRRHYARLYARPGAMHCAFNQFAAFTQDAADNKALAANDKLAMPIFALGGDHSFGAKMADIMRLVATDVSGGVIARSGHWVMEEQPKQTTSAVSMPPNRTALRIGTPPLSWSLTATALGPRSWWHCVGTTSTSPPAACMYAEQRAGMPACIRYLRGKAGRCASFCAKPQRPHTSLSRSVARRCPQPAISAWLPGLAWLRNSRSSCIPTCCGMRAGSSSPMTATTLAPSKPISATDRSCPLSAIRP
jgi:pimeloyl-ACP methyl ester carboxylesterase